jgi:CheY-like chemotaxis protein
MVLKLVVRSLEKVNYEVVTATNGREGLKMMKEFAFQAVLMDFLMPVMDGITATQLFREWEGVQISQGLRRGVQGIIGVSANAEKADIDAAITAGMDQVLPKPLKVR